jgi:uncharacterized protein YprB with RNaseH-like and TPR domain
MGDLAARLRGIVRGSAPRELTYELDSPGWRAPATLERLCESLGGTAFDTPAGSCLRISRRYESDRWYGNQRIGECEVTDLSALDTPGSPIFLDIETTGLSGGAGTVAFLVGCGFFDLGAFQIHQFLLPSYAAERALLAAVADSVAGAGCLVTYNGKTFDLPVMETRWLFHRIPPPLGEKAHLDMLHTARRLWRDREAPQGCNLSILERDLFGVRRTGDVPGFEIPSRYFRFLRTGDPAPLETVLEHNRLDLVSLAAVTARAAAIAHGGSPACRDGRERLAAGRLLERAGRLASAEQCYRDATADADAVVQSEGWCRLAIRLRRERRFAEAADAWRQVLASAPASSGAASALARQALAVHLEHRTGDLDGARTLALEALLDLEESRPRRREDLQHRLARLDRKIARRTDQTGGVQENLLDQPADEGCVPF